MVIYSLDMPQVMAFQEIVAQVLEAGGPIAHATKADAVRLHDDKVWFAGSALTSCYHREYYWALVPAWNKPELLHSRHNS